MQVDFYHLSRSPLEKVLPRIAERVLDQGGRLLVVAEDERLADQIDEWLWSYAPESFLPHGRAGRGGEQDQPVLISAGVAADNGARNVALADGVWRPESLAFDRAFLIFDADAVTAAREAWRSLGGIAEVTRNYWAQAESGRWEKQA